tara:strand:+ start:51 stop:503 length:453 start_codon:yes stop_codon:yes gene_type:complete
MMARFRRRERKRFRGGGNINVGSHDDGQTTDQILAKKNADDANAAEQMQIRNKVGGGRRRKNQRGGAEGETSETYVKPSSGNTSDKGNQSMGAAADLQAQQQANKKYEGGGRRRRRTRRRRRRSVRRKKRRTKRRKSKKRRRTRKYKKRR